MANAATPNAAAPNPKANMGAPVPRYDARLKVTGAARFASDMPAANPAYAVLVTSAIAKGRIASIDLDDAHAVPGVLDILTQDNTSELKLVKFGDDLFYKPMYRTGRMKEKAGNGGVSPSGSSLPSP